MFFIISKTNKSIADRIFIYTSLLLNYYMYVCTQLCFGIEVIRLSLVMTCYWSSDVDPESWTTERVFGFLKLLIIDFGNTFSFRTLCYLRSVNGFINILWLEGVEKVDNYYDVWRGPHKIWTKVVQSIIIYVFFCQWHGQKWVCYGI